MPVQVELLKRKYISVRGKVLEFPAGSTVDIGRQMALEWIAAGDAVNQEPEREAAPKAPKPKRQKEQAVPAASGQGAARVRLLTIKHISVAGKLRPFYPGDWVRVGRQTARAWIAAGEADYPGLDKVEAIMGKCKDCGVLVRGDKKAATHILHKYKQIKITGGRLPSLPFGRTLLWNPELKLTAAQAAVGFSRVESTGAGYDAWEVAAMLLSDRALAAHYGPKEEKQKTEAVVGDLRIPVYDTRAVWMRKTDTTRRLIKAWAAEIEAGANEAHAFLRALYSHPVLVCTLPAGWVGIR
jgi:hypothetical protein